MFKPLVLSLAIAFPSASFAEIGDTVKTQITDVGTDGSFRLDSGWSGRMWGVLPEATYAQWLYDTYVGVPLTCQHVGSTSVRLLGSMISRPIILCVDDSSGKFIHDEAIAAGTARELCVETDGLLSGTCP